MEKANKTLNVKESTKNELLALKVHPRESLDDILLRLIAIYKIGD